MSNFKRIRQTPFRELEGKEQIYKGLWILAKVLICIALFFTVGIFIVALIIAISIMGGLNSAAVTGWGEVFGIRSRK